jgi:hypothetical protein
MLVGLYQFLLFLFPARYRSTFGQEMSAVFQRGEADAWAAGAIPHSVFCIREFAGLILAAFRERARAIGRQAGCSEFSEQPVSTGSVSHAGDGLPIFYTCENYFPRRSALIHGSILSLALFNAVSAAYEYGIGHYRFPVRLGSSHDISQPQVIETKEAGLLSFGRALVASNHRVLTLILGRQPAAIDVKPHPGSWNSAWSNLLWVLRVRPNFVQSDGMVLLFAPSALKVQSSGEPRTDIINALIAQFDKSALVGLGEFHGSQEDQELRRKLIHHPDFAKKVRYIVVELGNSLHQEDLDRYIRGEDVSKAEVQRVWQDTTQVFAGDTLLTVCEQFLNDVRSVNRGLPNNLKIRVLAGDPPINWAKVKTSEEFASFVSRRDAFAAELIAREVVGKGQKALLIYGAGHFWRKTQFMRAGVVVPTPPNLAALMDKDFPGRLYVVTPIAGGVYRETAKLEALIQNVGRPVLLPLKRTIFGSLEANEFLAGPLHIPFPLFPVGLGIGEVADACVYRGQIADKRVAPDPSIAADTVYAAEIDRRRGLAPRPKQ